MAKMATVKKLAANEAAEVPFTSSLHGLRYSSVQMLSLEQMSSSVVNALVAQVSLVTR